MLAVRLEDVRPLYLHTWWRLEQEQQRQGVRSDICKAADLPNGEGVTKAKYCPLNLDIIDNEACIIIPAVMHCTAMSVRQTPPKAQ